MLRQDQSLAVFVEGELLGDSAKMGQGILRYSPNKVACVIDSLHRGKNVQDVIATPRSCPVVGTLSEARELGAEVLVLGLAPPGGLIPFAWFEALDEAISLGFSIVNGLHDLLGPRWPKLGPDQWVWDIRTEPTGLKPGTGAAQDLENKRVLMIGTDMAIGKMTAGLELYRAALGRGIKAAFVATGQIGITIMGRGIPLDAIRVDFACGAVEREVLDSADREMVFVEGQGSLLHPGSTSTLPLLRGSMPTHLVLCHRAGMDHLYRLPQIKIPPLRDFMRLYEDLAAACGAFPRPKSVAVALNTSAFGHDEAKDWLKRTSDETGLPCDDPVRFGCETILSALS